MDNKTVVTAWKPRYLSAGINKQWCICIMELNTAMTKRWSKFQWQRFHFPTSPLGHHPNASRRSREMQFHSLKKGRGSILVGLPWWAWGEQVPSVSLLADIPMRGFGVSLNITCVTFHIAWSCMSHVPEEGQLRTRQGIGEGRVLSCVKLGVLGVDCRRRRSCQCTRT